MSAGSVIGKTSPDRRKTTRLLEEKAERILDENPQMPTEQKISDLLSDLVDYFLSEGGTLEDLLEIAVHMAKSDLSNPIKPNGVAELASFAQENFLKGIDQLERLPRRNPPTSDSGEDASALVKRIMRGALD